MEESLKILTNEMEDTVVQETESMFREIIALENKRINTLNDKQKRERISALKKF